MKGKWGLIEIICKESNNILDVFINCCEYVYENKEKNDYCYYFICVKVVVLWRNIGMLSVNFKFCFNYVNFWYKCFKLNNCENSCLR